MTEPQSIRAAAEVVANPSEGGSNRRLRLGVDGWPGFSPGQFVMLSAGSVSAVARLDPLLPRPMAVYREVSSRNGGAEIEILYKITGRGTALLAEARPGDRVSLVGPLGRGFPSPPAGGRAILVGGGTGVASLFELAARAASEADVRVLLGARRESDLMGRADFESLAATLRIATEDGSVGHSGLVTELLEEELTDAEVGSVYACGPTAMMAQVAATAEAAGRPAIVSLENTMACGFGVCLGCAVPKRNGAFALVCREGPVFPAAELDWKELP